MSNMPQSQQNQAIETLRASLDSALSHSPSSSPRPEAPAEEGATIHPANPPHPSDPGEILLTPEVSAWLAEIQRLQAALADAKQDLKLLNSVSQSHQSLAEERADRIEELESRVAFQIKNMKAGDSLINAQIRTINRLTELLHGAMTDVWLSEDSGPERLVPANKTTFSNRV